MSDGNPLGFHKRWTRLKPTLRPDAQIVAAYGQAIKGHETRVLLLGVTAELADLGHTTVAVDLSRKMIDNAWPGDTESRKAVHGNWLNLPLQTREFTAVIGDGVLTGFELSEYPKFFEQLGKVLLPSARLALRLYETPERGETVAQVRTATMTGEIAGFHAFKWRLAMAIVNETKNSAVAVAKIHEIFEQAFPDRDALAKAAGWSLEEIAEIDAYAGKPMIYRFPKRSEILAHWPCQFSEPRFLPSGVYELSERCPILVADFRP